MITPSGLPEKRPVGVVEGIAKGVINSPLAFANDFVSLAEDLTGWATGEEVEWFNLGFSDDDLGTAGMITSEIGSFALGMITGSSVLSGLGKVGKLGKLGKLAGYLGQGARGAGGLTQTMAGGAVVGAASDFVLADTKGGNLSNLLNSFPQLRSPVTQFLAHQDDDSNIERRLKNMLEGIPLGVATDFLLAGFTKVLKVKRAAIDDVATGNPEQQADMIARETGVNTPAVTPASKSTQVLGELDNVLKAFDDTPDVDSVVKKVDQGAVEDGAKGADQSVVKDGAEVVDQRKAEDSITSIVEQNSDNPEALMAFVNKVKSSDVKYGTYAWKNVVTILTPDEYGKIVDASGGNAATYKSFLVIEGELAENAMKVVDDLGGLRNDVKMSGELAYKILAWKVYLVKRFESISELIDKVDGDSLSGLTELERAQLSIHVNQILEVMPLFKELRGNTARATTAQRIKVGGDRRLLRQTKVGNGEDKMLERALKNVSDNPNNIEVQKKALKVFQDNMDDIRKGKFGKTIKELEHRGIANRIMEIVTSYRTANILTGASTQGVNALGGALNFVLRDTFDNLLTTAVGSFRHGQERQSLAEAVAGMKGWFHGVNEIFQTSWVMFKSIEKDQGIFSALRQVSDILDGANAVKGNRLLSEGIREDAFSAKNMGLENTPLGAVIDAFGMLQRGLAYGPMKAGDNMFQSAGFSSAVDRMGTGILLSEGVGKEYMNQGIDKFRQIMQRAAKEQRIPNSIPQLWKERIEKVFFAAEDNAKRSTFQTPLRPGSTLSTINQWLNRKDILTPQVVKCCFVPFFKTPINILDSVWSHTPVLGMLRHDYREVMRGADRIAKDRLIAEMLTGSMLYSGGAALYFGGNLTGGHDADERESLLAAGIPEYSIKIGDRFYSYDRLDPFGSILGITADICSASRYVGDAEVTKMVGTLVMALTNNVTNKSYMQGMAQIFDLAKDPVNYSERIAVGQISALVPLTGLQRTVNQIIAPELKEARSLVDKVTANTVLKGAMRDKIDSLGGGFVHERTPLGSVLETVVGIKERTESKSRGYRELAKYRMFPKDREIGVRGVKTTDAEYIRFKEIMGELGTAEVLDRVVDSYEYRNSNDATRKKMLDRVVRRYRSAAGKILTKTSPDMQKRIIEKNRKTLALLGSTRTRGVAGNWTTVRDYRVEDEVE